MGSFLVKLIKSVLVDLFAVVDGSESISLETYFSHNNGGKL